MSGTRIKICGITNAEDAHQAVAAGADALGFVFYGKSPRCVDPERVREIVNGLPPFVTRVGLFVNAAPGEILEVMSIARLNVAQLHGDETPEDCSPGEFPVIKAIRVRNADSLTGVERYPVAALLLDAWSDASYGGTGRQFDWQLVRDLARQRPCILAGGLNPGNVREAIRTVRPYAVDVSSGVERAPGRKDHAKVEEFIRQVRNR